MAKSNPYWDYSRLEPEGQADWTPHFKQVYEEVKAKKPKLYVRAIEIAQLPSLVANRELCAIKIERATMKLIWEIINV